MGLLSFIKRRRDTSSTPTAAAAEPADGVQRARTRARRRLIGAAVLVGVGIIGFPLVFETQPRPIPVDIPIEMPRKDGAPPLVMPPARPPAAEASTAPAVPATSQPVAAAPLVPDIVVGAGDDAPAQAAASSPEPVASAAAVTPSAPARKTPAAPSPPVPDKAAVMARPRPAAVEPAHPKPASAAAPAAIAGRFVVQVGAFADADAAHQTRLKAEKLGLKTYTQMASTSAGNRIRVRLGPFATRDEAERALSKARGAGLTAVVLTL